MATVTLEVPELTVEEASFRPGGKIPVINGELSVWQTLAPASGANDAFAHIRSAAKNRSAQMTKRMERNFQCNARVDEAIRARKTYAQVRNVIQKSGAVVRVHKRRVTRFGPDGEVLAVEQSVIAEAEEEDADINMSYRNQANLELYSSENMRMRESNKYNEAVVKAIDDFWASLPKTLHANINKSIYTWFNRKLYFMFVASATEDDFQRTVHEDWRNDAVWSHVMTKRSFSDAIFNLADLWCETVDPKEYADFIRRCQAVCAQGPPYNGTRDENAVADRQHSRFLRRDSGDPDPFAAKGGDTPPAEPLAGPSGVRALVRRRSTAQGGAAAATPTEGAVVPPTPEEEVENLHDEALATAATAWFDILSTVQSLASQWDSDENDELGAMLRDLQDRRFLLRASASDEVSKNEKRWREAVRVLARGFAERRETLQQDLDYALARRTGTVEFRRAQRQRVRLTQLKNSEAILWKIREALVEAKHVAQDARESAAKSELTRVKAVIEKEELMEIDALRATLLIHEAKAIGRRCALATMTCDAVSRELFLATKGIEVTQTLFRNSLDDPLLPDVFPEYFAYGDPKPPDQVTIPEVNKMKFGNSCWKTAVSWLERLRSRRYASLDAFVDTYLELVKEAKESERHHLNAGHRDEMEWETAIISAIAEDKTLPSAFQLKHLPLLQEVKKKNTQLRKNGSDHLTTRHAAWDESASDLLRSVTEIRDAEQKQLAAWMNCKNMQAAWEASEEMRELYAGQMPFEAMEETVSVAARPAMLSESRATEVLPPDVDTPYAFFVFMLQREQHMVASMQRSHEFLRSRLLEERMGYTTGLVYTDAGRSAEMERQVSALRMAVQASRRESAASPEILSAMGPEVSGIIHRSLAHQFAHPDVYEDEDPARAAQLAEERESARQLSITRGRDTRLALQRITRNAASHDSRIAELDQVRRTLHETHMQRTNTISHRTAANEAFELNLREQDERARLRRVREQERIASEAAARAAQQEHIEAERVRRFKEAEAARNAAADMEKKRAAAMADARRKQLAEKEKQLKAREELERAEKKKWREQFLAEEAARKAEEARRFDATRLRSRRDALGPAPLDTKEVSAPSTFTTSGESATAKATPTHRKGSGGDTTAAAAAAAAASAAVASPSTAGGATKAPVPVAGGAKTKVVRRPTVAYHPGSVVTSKDVTAGKKVKAVTAPSAKIRQAIDNEIAAFGTLATQSMAVNLENFADRRNDYMLESASNAAIYQLECMRLRIPAVARVSSLMSNTELLFEMSRLDVSDMPDVKLATLHDVIMLNPIQLLLARRSKLDKDQVKKLSQILSVHGFITALDVSGNPDLGAHGGEALLALAKANNRIVNISAKDCGIPEATLAAIGDVLKHNAFQREVGRTEFDFLRTVFKEVDTDGSGIVTVDELRAYNERHHALLGSRSEQFHSMEGSGSSTEERIAEGLNRRLEHIRDHLLALDKKGTESFTLSDLIRLVYPALSIDEADALCRRYGDETNEGTSMTELATFINQFGTDGTVTLHQLAKGLGEEAEALRGAFQECDIDCDGKLTIEEFMNFVGM